MSETTKVRLTLTYETESSDIEDLLEAVEEFDEQYLFEMFGIGGETPVDKKLEIELGGHDDMVSGIGPSGDKLFNKTVNLIDEIEK